MLLKFEGLLLVQPFTQFMTQAEGERQQSHQAIQSLRVRQMGRFQTEATGFQSRKERLNFLPLGVVLHRLFGERRGN